MQKMEECIYSKNEVCQLLGITAFTLQNWYRWEKKEIECKEVTEPYLPVPQKLNNAKGRPLRWSLEMIEELKLYQHQIVKGRNGIYGKYTNLCWH